MLQAQSLMKALQLLQRLRCVLARANCSFAIVVGRLQELIKTIPLLLDLLPGLDSLLELTVFSYEHVVRIHNVLNVKAGRCQLS